MPFETNIVASVQSSGSINPQPLAGSHTPPPRPGDSKVRSAAARTFEESGPSSPSPLHLREIGGIIFISDEALECLARNKPISNIPNSDPTSAPTKKTLINKLLNPFKQ